MAKSHTQKHFIIPSFLYHIESYIFDKMIDYVFFFGFYVEIVIVFIIFTIYTLQGYYLISTVAIQYCF